MTTHADMPWVCGVTLASVLLLAGFAHGGEDKPLPPPKAPEGFSGLRLISRPEITAPACIAAMPDGRGVFVAEDPHNVRCKVSGTGRIVLALDADGDGKPERISVYADKVNGARGMRYCDGVLYVVAAPTLSALRDTDGDGVADNVEILVENLGEAPEVRAPDHAINGVHLAIDGWLYIACGDQGVPGGAKGRDGRIVRLDGGGILRVRPDGTGLEVFATGLRNIYDVAVSPTLHGFARENSHDQGGWKVRIYNPVAMSDAGYPARYKDFADECLPMMADAGGGSGCGGTWCDEPAAPASAQGFLSCDWGKGTVFVHQPKAAGAGFADEVKTFFTCPRPTDVEVDHRGRIYVAEWGGGIGLAKGRHGSVLRLDPARSGPQMPDLAAASDAELARHVAGPGQLLRLEAQRVALRRGPKPLLVAGLASVAEAKSDAAGRIAAIFTLALLEGQAGVPRLVRYVADTEMRPYALRALADRAPAADLPAEPFVTACGDPDPRVRLQAAIGLGRLARAELAPRLLPLADDVDAVVRHVATNALRTLGAVDAYLAAAGGEGAAALAALRVLRGCRTTVAVAGVAALAQRGGDATRLRAIVETLAYLAKTEQQPRAGWWSTRPKGKGPWYQPVDWEGSAEAMRALDAIAARSPELAAVVKAAKVRFAFVQPSDGKAK